MKVDVSIIFPCLNEEKTIGKCVKDAYYYLNKYNINGEVIVVDNNSSDNSFNEAEKNNARVITCLKRGYGEAIKTGILNAKGKYIIQLDADDTYDLADINKFYEEIKQGYDLIVGNRFYNIERGAMPPLNRYFGNPFLTKIGNILFKTNIKDYNCGLRIYNKKRILELGLESSDMSFATEVVIKASKRNYMMKEIPTSLKKTVDRKPHLKPFRDGTKLLIFMVKIYFKY